MRQKLTDIAIRQLPHPESGDVKYWDITVPGFGVRLTARTKSFFVVRGQKRQLTTIGRYPEISLQDARKEARRLLVQEAPENTPARLTEAVATYLKEAETRLRPTTLTEYRRYLTSLPDKQLKDLTNSYLKLYMGQSFNGFSKGKARMDKTINDHFGKGNEMVRLGVPLHVTERLLNHVSYLILTYPRLVRGFLYSYRTVTHSQTCEYWVSPDTMETSYDYATPRGLPRSPETLTRQLR